MSSAGGKVKIFISWRPLMIPTGEVAQVFGPTLARI